MNLTKSHKNRVEENDDFNTMECKFKPQFTLI
jgi:hypothetical protein